MANGVVEIDISDESGDDVVESFHGGQYLVFCMCEKPHTLSIKGVVHFVNPQY